MKIKMLYKNVLSNFITINKIKTNKINLTIYLNTQGAIILLRERCKFLHQMFIYRGTSVLSYL